jgi:hypothetical protein
VYKRQAFMSAEKIVRVPHRNIRVKLGRKAARRAAKLILLTVPAISHTIYATSSKAALKLFIY